MSDLPTSNLTAVLQELLALHGDERLCMKEARHLDHEACIFKKLQKALEAEKALAKAENQVTQKDLQLLGAVKMAAEANAAIAAKMLESTRKKIDFIHKMASPSYGSDGKLSQPKLSGGLLDTKA